MKLGNVKKIAAAVTIGLCAATVTLESANAQTTGGDLLVCSTTGDHAIKRYDRATGAFLGNFIANVPFPHSMEYGPDGKVYVARAGDMYDVLGPGGVSRYDANGTFIDDFVPVGSGGLLLPGDIEFGPDGNLYVLSFSLVPQDNAIRRYDGTTGNYLGDFVPGAANGGLQYPAGFTFGPGGDLYVASGGTNSIKRYSGVTGAYLGDFVAPGAGGLTSPPKITFGPDGNLYVTSGNPAGVLRFDGSTGAFIDSFTTASFDGMYDLRFGADGKFYVMIAASQSGVLRFDAATGAFESFLVAPNSGGLSEARCLNFLPWVLAIGTPSGELLKPINPKSHGVIPVSVFGSSALSVAVINPDAVRFGKTGTEATPVHHSIEDVNGDGYPDLNLKFETQSTGIACGDTSAVLTVRSIGGEPMSGSESIKTVGCPK